MSFRLDLNQLQVFQRDKDGPMRDVEGSIFLDGNPLSRSHVCRPFRRVHEEDGARNSLNNSRLNPIPSSWPLPLRLGVVGVEAQGGVVFRGVCAGPHLAEAAARPAEEARFLALFVFFRQAAGFAGHAADRS